MRRSAAIRAITILTVCFCLAPTGALKAKEPAADAASLDAAIEKVLQKRIYQWRMPRTAAQQKEEMPRGPIASFFKWLGDGTLAGVKFLGELLRQLIEWLESLIPASAPKPEKTASGWMTPVRLLLTSLLALLAAGLVYGLWRFLKKRARPQAKITAAAAAAAADLAQEGIRADELPAGRWLGLARQMSAKGDLRLAMRAFYLATLARLADRELITIEFSKSNLEYKRELDRRTREKNELQAAFAHSILRFERTWYGLKTITRRELDDFARLQEEIIGFAES